MKNAMSEYKTFGAAYTFLNERLFHEDLPASCMITLNRRGNYDGYFGPGHFVSRVSSPVVILDEIAINSDRFASRGDEEILSILGHQMVHAWVHYYSRKRSRPTYHGQQWANKMEQIGLMPSSTGQPDGERTGQKVEHYIIEGGCFQVTSTEFLDGAVLEWNSLPDAKKTPASKVKYTCPVPACQQNAWAKEFASLICGHCNVQMMAQQSE